MRVGKVVFPKKQFAELHARVGIQWIGKERAVVRFERILEQLRIVGAEIFDRGRHGDQFFARQVRAAGRVVRVDEPVELFCGAIALAAIEVQDSEIERRGQTIARVLGAGANERALGGGPLAADERDFAQRVPELRATLCRRAAASGVFRLVVLANRRVGARELPLRGDPLAVRCRDL